MVLQAACPDPSGGSTRPGSRPERSGRATTLRPRGHQQRGRIDGGSFEARLVPWLGILRAMRTERSYSTSPKATRTYRRAEARISDRLHVQAPVRSLWRYHVVRILLGRAARTYWRVRVEGVERFPRGPSGLCFSHQNWADPFLVFAAILRRPRFLFFGAEQEDMRRGPRNRLMRWGGVTVPYEPGNRGLLAATARVQQLIRGGASIAIAGEGRIHSGEAVILPLRAGAAYVSLRAGAQRHISGS